MELERAKAALAGTRFADLRWVAETGSTNADLVAATRSGAGDTALIADHQSAGRGRLDRRWEAPSGASLLMSVLVRPPFPVGGVNLLGTALAVATVDALAEVAGLEVGLKWPNDVVAPGAGALGQDLKLGGLLAEFTVGAGGESVVLGLGLNVAWSDVGFPEELADRSTAIDLLGGSAERADLAISILRSLDDCAELATSSAKCAALVQRYRQRCVTIGRRVRVQQQREDLTGTAVDVRLDGALLMRTDDGAEHVVTVGDVVHLRQV